MNINSQPRICVMRFSALGDIVLTTSSLESLHRVWPNAQIIYATKLHYQPLLEPHPFIQQVVSLKPNENLIGFLQRLRSFEFDAVLDLHNVLRTKILRLGLRVPNTVIIKKRPWTQELLVRARWQTYHARQYFAESFHAAVEKLTTHKCSPSRIRLYVDDIARTSIQQRFNAMGIPCDKSLVALVPGAKWETKRWPLEYFIKLARWCRHKNLPVVLLGNRAEAPLTMHISKEVKGCWDLKGELDLAELVAMIDQCRVVIANDTGPMHIARSLGIPTLAIFGSTDHKAFDFNEHGYVAPDIKCSPCSLYGLKACPKKHFKCMHEITPDRVQTALIPLLDKGRVNLVEG